MSTMSAGGLQMTCSDDQLVVCGWDEVFIWALGEDACALPRKTWSWRARGRADLPPEFSDRFGSTDECKPFDQGRRLLITSSGGAVALVDREHDRVMFYGRAANAHSADLLPDNLVAVAASHSPDGTGDRLILFDLAHSDQELSSTELPWGHGVVWDSDRNRLWALSNEEVRAYALERGGSSAPRLRRIASFPLPEGGGHDLHPVGQTPLLSVTTRSHCWHFDRDSGDLDPHPRLASAAHVKSLTHHPHRSQVAYVQATAEVWWAERIHTIDPERTVTVPGEHFYKARWNM